ANGSPAFWQTRPGPAGHVPFALVLLDVLDGQVAGITTYLDADRLLLLFQQRPAWALATPGRPG
ncbi:MAG TPA: hypothetical protein VM307_11445, partial [Egibacteraceae bacterium]|nr:hypothetical protein [Egibacteraceae bacterium]